MNGMKAIFNPFWRVAPVLILCCAAAGAEDISNSLNATAGGFEIVAADTDFDKTLARMEALERENNADFDESGVDTYEEAYEDDFNEDDYVGWGTDSDDVTPVATDDDSPARQGGAATDDDSAAGQGGAATDDGMQLAYSPASGGAIEEVRVFGRATSGGGAKLRMEIFEADVHIDALSSLEISRNGDSNAASSLARLPGLSLVDDKFIYVRGLGERYSSSALNRAYVPSPDLTRDVLPLNIFPSAIIESVAVRKSYEADRPAAFGGGEIDLRTKVFPSEFFFELKADVGTSSDQANYKTYPNHTTLFGSLPDKEAFLSPLVYSALTAFGGRIDPVSINIAAPVTDLAGAQAINRTLALELNRNYRVTPSSPDPDIGFHITGGDSYTLNDDETSLGYIAFLSFDQSQRHYNITHRQFRSPDTDFSHVDESEQNINLVGYASAGMEFSWNQKISINYIFLRNSTDKTYIEDVNHSTFTDDISRRRYWLRYQSHDLITWQLRGSHGPEDFLHIKWHFSFSRVLNDIPGELDLETRIQTDPESGTQAREVIPNNLSNLELGYTSLSGRTDNFGLSTAFPFGRSDRHQLEFGFDVNTERRNLNEVKIEFGSNKISTAVTDGDLLGAFTNEYINNPANGVGINYDPESPTSYNAAARQLSFFGLYRLGLGDFWRLSGGIRYERHRHSTSLLNAIGVSVLSNTAKYANGAFYPSLSAVYTTEGNAWSDVFQLRLSYGRTVVRPDVREISEATYVDPITDARITGSAEVTPALIDNLNAAVAWRFDGGEFLSLTVFYKSISDPIETFEAAKSDTDTSSLAALDIANAQSALVYGIELGGRINFLREQMFVSGNVSLLQSSLTAGDEASAPTSTSRPLSNASDYIANMALGYEHPEGDHMLRLVYTFAGERLYFAGRNGAPDAYEAPTSRLNLNYIYSFGAGFKLQIKIANIFDEDVSITRANQVVYSSNIGREFSTSLSWRY